MKVPSGWVGFGNHCEALLWASGCNTGPCFPDRRLMGTESKVSGGFGPLFENQDPASWPSRKGLLPSWGGGCAVPRGALRTKWWDSPLPGSQSIPSKWQQGQGKEQLLLLSHSCLCWWPCSSNLPGYIMSTHPDLKVSHSCPKHSSRNLCRGLFYFCFLLLWC